jgi:hypothetical protein
MLRRLTTHVPGKTFAGQAQLRSPVLLMGSPRHVVRKDHMVCVPQSYSSCWSLHHLSDGNTSIRLDVLKGNISPMPKRSYILSGDYTLRYPERLRQGKDKSPREPNFRRKRLRRWGFWTLFLQSQDNLD